MDQPTRRVSIVIRQGIEIDAELLKQVALLVKGVGKKGIVRGERNLGVRVRGRHGDCRQGYDDQRA